LRSYRPLIGFIFLAIVVVGILIGLSIANYRFAKDNPGGNDFLARWMGARFWLMEGTSPYAEQVSMASQQAIYGHAADPQKGEDKNHFVYPMTSMIFFAPFGLLEYLYARALWMTVLEVSIFLIAVLGLRLVDWSLSPVKTAILVLFSVLWYHSARTIMIGQFAGLNAVLIVFGLILIRKKQDFVAGLVLALTTTKPQMTFLLIPFILLWALSVRRWELWWGIWGGFLGTLGLSLAFIPDWPLQMLRQVLDYPSYTNIGSPLTVIANAMPGISRSLILFLHAAVGSLLLVEWILAWGQGERHFLWAAMMTMVITNLVAFRTATTNYVMLLPAIYLIFSVWEERWTAIGRALVWVNLLMLGIGIWALFLYTVEGNVEHASMYLPVPIYCLFGLWWVRWWAIRPPRLPFQQMVSKLRL